MGGTRRSRLLKLLRRNIQSLAPFATNQSYRRIIFHLVRVYDAVDSHRYLNRHIDDGRLLRPTIYTHVPRIIRDRGVPFMRNFRCAFEKLEYIVSLFEKHPVFHTVSTKPQAPPLYQIAALMYSLAHEDAVYQVASQFYVQTGTIHKWCNRAMTAIVDNARNFIYWPDGAERRRISHWFEERYKIPDCCGIMDGTHVHFKMRPSLHDPESFWCHHHSYGTNVMVIVDHLCRFRHIQVGFPGSASDSRIQGNLRVFQRAVLLC